MTDFTTPTFQPGDVVKMKRVLGPHMTVESVQGIDKDFIRCIWFDCHSIVQRCSFDAYMLELVRP